MRKFLKFNKNRVLVLLGLLALCLGGGLYLNLEKKYDVIFEKNSVYHIRGKNNNCLWVINIKEEITTEPGDSSVAFIGIPSIQTGGSLGAMVQVTPSSVLLAFNLPNNANNYRLPPVVLTSDLKNLKYPVEHLKFAWMRSDAFTMKLYKDLNSCVKDGAGKDDS